MGEGKGRGPGTQGGPTALQSQQVCFQDNLREGRAEGGREALGSCHWTLICPARLEAAPELTLSLPCLGTLLGAGDEGSGHSLVLQL